MPEGANILTFFLSCLAIYFMEFVEYVRVGCAAALDGIGIARCVRASGRRWAGGTVRAFSDSDSAPRCADTLMPLTGCGGE